MVKRGFTLIELLVVIAIIAILAAILFPVFSKAREKGRQTQCLSNQRQIAASVMMYTQEHEEIFPKSATFWSELKLASALQSSSTAMLAVPKVVTCPDSRKSGNGYVYNNNLSGRSLGDMTTGSADPTANFLTADGYHVSTGSGNYDNIAYTMTDLEYRHDKKVIASFLDGHTDSRTLPNSTISGSKKWLDDQVTPPGGTLPLVTPGSTKSVDSGSGQPMTWTVQTESGTSVSQSDVSFDGSPSSTKDFTFNTPGKYQLVATNGSDVRVFHVNCGTSLAAAVYNPTTNPSLGALDSSGTVTFDTSALTVSGTVNASGVAQAVGAVTAAVFTFDYVNLTGSVFVVGSRPLVICSKGDITIATTINVSGQSATSNSATSGIAGGGNGGAAFFSGTSPFAGNKGAGLTDSGGGPASGGGYGGAGGNGTGGLNMLGGAIYGDTTISDLYGGAGGGGTSQNSGPGAGGGAGGGAIELSAVGTITISGGSILADGGNAWSDPFGGGGGSGGAILLSAASVNLSGTLSAKGGTAYSTAPTFPGGGGGGRISIFAGNAPATLPAGASVNGGSNGAAGSYSGNAAYAF